MTKTWFHLGKPSKKKTAYFVTLDQKVGGYLFQNIISFEEEIVTYIKGGWVSNTDVTISYIHFLLFFFAYFHFPICKFWLIYVYLIEYKITITFNKLKMCMCIQRHQILCSMWGSKNQIKYDLCHNFGGVGG